MHFASYRYPKNQEHPGILPTLIKARSIATALNQAFEQCLKESQIQLPKARGLHTFIRKTLSRRKESNRKISILIRNKSHPAIVHVTSTRSPTQRSYRATLSPNVEGKSEQFLYVIVIPISPQQVAQISELYQVDSSLKTLIHRALTQTRMSPTVFKALTQYHLQQFERAKNIPSAKS